MGSVLSGLAACLLRGGRSPERPADSAAGDPCQPRGRIFGAGLAGPPAPELESSSGLCSDFPSSTLYFLKREKICVGQAPKKGWSLEPFCCLTGLGHWQLLALLREECTVGDRCRCDSHSLAC